MARTVWDEAGMAVLSADFGAEFMRIAEENGLAARMRWLFAMNQEMGALRDEVARLQGNP